MHVSVCMRIEVCRCLHVRTSPWGTSGVRDHGRQPGHGRGCACELGRQTMYPPQALRRCASARRIVLFVVHQRNCAVCCTPEELCCLLYTRAQTQGQETHVWFTRAQTIDQETPSQRRRTSTGRLRPPEKTRPVSDRAIPMGSMLGSLGTCIFRGHRAAVSGASTPESAQEPWAAGPGGIGPVGHTTLPPQAARPRPRGANANRRRRRSDRRTLGPPQALRRSASLGAGRRMDF
jgi:hypothetical protein